MIEVKKIIVSNSDNSLLQISPYNLMEIIILLDQYLFYYLLKLEDYRITLLLI